MDAAEQEDLTGAFGQRPQGRLDALQVVIDLQGLVGGLAVRHAVRIMQAFSDPVAAAFAAQVVDSQVAGAAQQVGIERLDLHLGAPPEAQEQVLHQVRRRGAAADAAADQRLHARTLGEEHLEEACPPAAGLGGHPGHQHGDPLHQAQGPAAPMHGEDQRQQQQRPARDFQGSQLPPRGLVPEQVVEVFFHGQAQAGKTGEAHQRNPQHQLASTVLAARGACLATGLGARSILPAAQARNRPVARAALVGGQRVEQRQQGERQRAQRQLLAPGAAPAPEHGVEQ
ncbi:hypothetical protein WR25_06588 [Diploscapter pachys]|uniref:Uncharacterized protein n=1 Tax=Diploscapter pachys TaxID=2018661 RepID=A0A2A2K9E4_9BILA|nr:hypothetical protein WR25_06588 [Diploscapter pachys]